MAAKDSVQVVQRLREATGAGGMECKKALQEAGGDFDKAVRLVRERGVAKGEKRSGRETGAGVIFSYVHNDRIGALVDLRAETDFVARSEPFRALGREIAMQVAAMAPDSIDTLMSQPYIKDESRTIEELVKDVIARVGENVTVNSFHRLQA